MSKTGVVVGRMATVRRADPQPAYFTSTHRRFVGQTGRIHAIVAAQPRENPLVKVGFGEPQVIAFFRLADLDVDRGSERAEPLKHGERGSHLPRS